VPNQDETKPAAAAFDFTAFPGDTLFYDRREGLDRRERPPLTPQHTPTPTPPPEVRPEPDVDTPAAPPAARAPAERRAKKERRRRIDPTTFEKQYTDDEMEFMNAMQRFKIQSGKSFPSHGDVLRVAVSLGYRQSVPDDDPVALDHADDPSESVEVSVA